MAGLVVMFAAVFTYLVTFLQSDAVGSTRPDMYN